MPIRLTGDRIAVRTTTEETTAGGLLIPEEFRSTQQIGTVVAVGPGRSLPNGAVVTLPYYIGDQVIFSKLAGHEAEIDGEKLLILEEKDILATP